MDFEAQHQGSSVSEAPCAGKSVRYIPWVYTLTAFLKGILVSQLKNPPISYAVRSNLGCWFSGSRARGRELRNEDKYWIL